LCRGRRAADAGHGADRTAAGQVFGEGHRGSIEREADSPLSEERAGKALADLPQAKWAGWTAWLFWRSVYITKLVSFSNKVKVLFDWLKAQMFGRDLSRF
jgi:hypothetical protein